MTEIRIIPAAARYADRLNRASVRIEHQRHDALPQHGVVVETTKRLQKLDGEYDDEVLRALFLEG